MPDTPQTVPIPEGVTAGMPDTTAQARADLPKVEQTLPWEDEPRLDLPPTSKVGKALKSGQEWFEQKVLQPTHRMINEAAEGLMRAGETGHTPSGGQLNPTTRLLLQGAGTLLRWAPVGETVKETAGNIVMQSAAPELRVEEGEAQALRAGTRAAEEAAPVPTHYYEPKTKKILPVEQPKPTLGPGQAVKEGQPLFGGGNIDFSGVKGHVLRAEAPGPTLPDTKMSAEPTGDEPLEHTDEPGGEPEAERIRRLGTGSREATPRTPEEIAGEAERKERAEAEARVAQQPGLTSRASRAEPKVQAEPKLLTYGYTSSGAVFKTLQDPKVQELAQQVGVHRAVLTSMPDFRGLNLGKSWYDFTADLIKKHYDAPNMAEGAIQDEMVRYLKGKLGAAGPSPPAGRLTNTQIRIIVEDMAQGKDTVLIDKDVEGKDTVLHEILHSLTEGEAHPIAEKGYVPISAVRELHGVVSNAAGTKRPIASSKKTKEFVTWASQPHEFITETMTQYFLGNVPKGSKLNDLAEALLRHSKNPYVQGLIGTTFGLALMIKEGTSQQVAQDKLGGKQRGKIPNVF